jgi:PhnB protein
MENFYNTPPVNASILYDVCSDCIIEGGMLVSDPSKASTAGFRVTATPYLCVKHAAEAIAFYKKAFGAIETSRIPDDDGKISHAEIQIGDARIMISDEYPEIKVLSPESIGGSPVMIVLEVEDVDSLFQQAVVAGAVVDRSVMDRFDGAMRNGKLNDPFGHRWMLVTHLIPQPKS